MAATREVIFDYFGAETCKAAAQFLDGFKKCPFACLGLGDCVRVCPEDAISIDPEKNIAFIDTQKCTGCGLCVAGVVERVKGLEPSTSCLGSKHSTAELHPPKSYLF